MGQVLPEDITVLLFVLLVGIAVARLGRRRHVPEVVSLLLLGMTLRLVGGYLGVVLEPLTRFGVTFVGMGLMSMTLLTILFIGGLETELAEFIETVNVSIPLATVGVIVTAALTGLVVWLVMGFPPPLALLIGAVISSTDPTVVIPILKGIKVKRRLWGILRSESVLDDAMCIALVFSLLALLTEGTLTVGQVAGSFVWQVIGGLTVGLGVGYLIGNWMSRISWRPDEVNVLSLVIPVTAFLLAESIRANGFLAALVTGLLLGNSRRSLMRIVPPIGRIPRKKLIDFWGNIAFLLEVITFVMLGFLIDPLILYSLLPYVLLLIAIVLFVARPIEVVICTVTERRLNRNDRIFLIFAGFRATVPAILAFAVLGTGIPAGDLVVNLVLGFVLVSTIAQGLLVRQVATRLGVLETE